MENTSKPKKKKIIRNKFIKRFLKFIVIVYIVLIIIAVVLNNYVEDKRNIYEKIGSSEPYSISIKDALNIKVYSIMTYADYIKSEDYEAAYEMLTEEYKEMVSYENYIKTIESIDFETFDMKEIKIKTENTYVATIVYEKDGEPEETTYLLYLNPANPKIITISPDEFIYGYKDLKFKMDNVEFKLQECGIYTDSVKVIATIKNTSLFDTMVFNNVGVGYDNSTNRSEDIELVLRPGETKEIEISYDTNYYIPNNIKIKRLIDEDTLRTYTFYFEDAK